MGTAAAAELVVELATKSRWSGDLIASPTGLLLLSNLSTAGAEFCFAGLVCVTLSATCAEASGRCLNGLKISKEPVMRAQTETMIQIFVAS